MPRQARGHTHLRSEDAELGTRNTNGAVLVFPLSAGRARACGPQCGWQVDGWQLW